MRWVVWVVVLVHALWPHTGRCQTFSDVSLVLGMQALEQGDDAQAMGYLVPAANNSPNNTLGITARFLAAQAAANLGLWEQASLYLQKLEVAMPEISDVILARQAQAWRSLGAWDKAQGAWRRVLVTTHAADLRANAAFGIADADYAMGRWDRAMLAYRTAIALPKQKTRSVIARLNMGIIEQERHNVAAAAGLFRDVAYKGHDEICADVAQTHLEHLQRTAQVPAVAWGQQLDRLDYWIRNRNFERAKRDLDAMRRSFADVGQQQTLSSRQAQLALRQRDTKGAIALLQKLVKTAVGRQKTVYQRDVAAALASDGQLRQSVAQYRTIAAANVRAQDGRDALYRAAFLSHDGGDYKLAGQLFAEYLRRYPSDKMRDEARWYVAWSAYRLGDMADAQVHLTHIEAKAPPGALRDRARYWLGRIAVSRGEPEVAAGYFGKLASAPNTYYGMWASWRLQDLDISPPAAPATADIEHPARALPIAQHVATVSPSVATPSVASDGLSKQALPPTMLAQASWQEQFNTPVATDWTARSNDAAPLACTPTLPRTKITPANHDWGDEAFDWTHPAAVRVLSLLRLGMSDTAASEVGLLPTLPGLSSKTAAYKRARLLSRMGSLGAAFRLVALHFPDVLAGPMQGSSRRYFELAYPTVYGELVASAARDAAVSHWLVYAIMRQESRFDARAQSAVNALGLMQIMPATGRRVAQALAIKRYNDALLAEPAYNVRFGAWYTAQLLKRFASNAALAAASYNAGPQVVGRWVQTRSPLPTDAFIEEIPFKETRLYVKNVMTNLAVYSALYSSEAFRLPEHITIATSQPELGVDF